MAHIRFGLFLTCVFLSGAASLVLEVVWARQLTLFLGTTAHAHAAVLGAFMLGLALGAVVLGRRVDRVESPLRLYALLEIGIGVYALLSPGLFDWLQTTWATMAGGVGTGATAGRFLLALGALLIPTFLMGGTFPVLVRAVELRRPGLLRSVSGVYGVNTLGAAAGALAAGYFLLPTVGVSASIKAAAGTDLGVALLVLTVLRGAKGGSSPRAHRAAGDRSSKGESRSATRLDLSVLLAGLAISGFAALLLQMAWVRALILILGSSVYAFSACLAAYLLGLALGGLVAPRVLAPAAGFRVGVVRAGVIEAAVALAVVAGLPWFERLPGVFLAGYRAGLFETFVVSQIFQFGLAASLVIVPTFLLGLLFPMLLALWAGEVGATGRGVGIAYSANTLGAVAGAVAGGLLLLPALGLQGSLVLAAGLQLAVGAGLWWIGQRPHGTVRRLSGPVAAAVAVALLVGVLPRWDQRLLTSGPHFNVERWARGLGVGDQGEARLQGLLEQQKLLFYEEGVDATVAVIETGKDRLLVINGKTDASRDGDLPTQVLLAQLPLLVHSKPKRAMVVGLGSGTTVGSAATHTSLERIDVVEISPEVVAASRYFNESSRFALADERVRLHLEDARNFLLATDERWDVIVSEPSNPWVSGVANLFTREFFALMRSRLEPGGVAAQWIHTYKLSLDELRTVLATFLAVFPHATAWFPMAGDLILLGSEGSHGLDYRRLETVFGRPAIGEDLRRIGIADPADLVRAFLIPEEKLVSLAEGAPLNTDDRPRIEFSAPRSLYAETTATNFARILEHLGEEPVTAPVTGWIERTPVGFSSAALGLDIRIDAPPERHSARWMVRWKQLEQLDEDLPALVYGERRILEWREEGAAYKVSASRLDHQPDLVHLAALVESWRDGELVARGDLLKEGTPHGVWEVARAEDGHLAGALAWTCPDEPPLVLRILATRHGPDPEGSEAAAAVMELGGRFRCR